MALRERIRELRSSYVVGYRGERTIQTPAGEAVRIADPEFRVPVGWLKASGFYPGDSVRVSSPMPGLLFLERVLPQECEVDPMIPTDAHRWPEALGRAVVAETNLPGLMRSPTGGKRKRNLRWVRPKQETPPLTYQESVRDIMVRFFGALAATQGHAGESRLSYQHGSRLRPDVQGQVRRWLEHLGLPPLRAHDANLEAEAGQHPE